MFAGLYSEGRYPLAGLTRRRFLRGGAATLGAMAAGRSWLPAAAQQKQSRERQRALELLEREASFDLHCHPGGFFRRGDDGYDGDRAVTERLGDMVEGRLAGAFVSIVADRKILHIAAAGPRATRAFEPGEAWADYRKQLFDVRELLSAGSARLALGPGDVPSAPGDQVATFLSVEGGDCLEGRVDRVEGLYVDGVRSLQLVHYAANDVGDLQTEEPVHGGLSAFGHQVVAEMERFGMVVDVAHASLETVRDVVEQTANPLILSHSHLQTDEVQHPRLLTPEHAEVVAATGGVIGMWPSGIANRSFEDFVDNTRRLVDLVGVDHVGLGTDMDGNFMPVFEHYAQLADWAGALGRAGMSDEEVAKLVGGNARRILGQVLRREEF